MPPWLPWMWRYVSGTHVGGRVELLDVDRERRWFEVVMRAMDRNSVVTSVALKRLPSGEVLHAMKGGWRT